MVERLARTKAELQELLAKTNTMTASADAVSAAELDFAGAFAKLGSHSKSNSHSAAANTESFVISTSKLNALRKAFHREATACLFQPIVELVQHDIAQANQLLGSYEKARLHLSVCAGSLKSLTGQKADVDSLDHGEEIGLEARIDKNLSKSKKDLLEAQALARTARSHLVDVCHTVEAKRTQLMEDNLPRYAKARALFLEKALQVRRETHTLLRSLCSDFVLFSTFYD